MTVAFATANGTATAGSDYGAASGILTFPPGMAALAAPVLVLGDTLVEIDESFALHLSAPQNASLGTAQAEATIADDDAPPLPGEEIAHGSLIHADLSGAPDLYRLAQAPRSSYEVTIDATSGDIVPLTVDRLAADQSTVLQTAAPVGAGPSVSLRFENTTPLLVTSQRLRVAGSCAGACASDDVYRIRAVETTGSIARFNNTGSQVTVLVLQNPTVSAVAGNAWFWSAGGALLARRPFTLVPRETSVFNTATVEGLVRHAAAAARPVGTRISPGLK